MASAVATSAVANMQTNEEEEEMTMMIKIGNLHFCRICKNLMIVRSENDVLFWECSIKCAQSVAVAAAAQLLENVKRQNQDSDNNPVTTTTLLPTTPIILSQTIELNTHQNPHNKYTKYDPSLLRTLKVCPNRESVNHQKDPEKKSEMIIFKQSTSLAESYYICTVCERMITLNDQLIPGTIQ